jgi:hypothetical protein
VSTHAPIDPQNRKIAIVIAILAALLAVSESAGKNAQTTALAKHIEASNLWAFFQAKTIRLTTVRTASELLEAEMATIDLPAEKTTAVAKRISSWRDTTARYDSEPETGEGRKELMARAIAAEADRDRRLGAYHLFEFSSAAFQIAIVLASASVITAAVWLAMLAGGLGAVGIGFALLGFLAPTLVHF